MAFLPNIGGTYQTGGNLYDIIQKDLGLISEIIQECFEEVKFIVYDEAMTWAIEYFPLLTGLLLSTFREMSYDVTESGFIVKYACDPVSPKGVEYAAIVNAMRGVYWTNENTEEQFWDKVNELINIKFNEYIPIVFNRKANEILENIRAVME